MRLIDADELIKSYLDHNRTEFEIKNCCMANENVIAIIQNAPTVADRTEEVLSLQNTIAKLVRGIAENAPTVELTEEQAIDKLHETGWLIRHDKEMTERPHGKWMPNKVAFYWVCSECGAEVRSNIAEVYLTEHTLNFCPNCGADMRKGEI